MEWLNPALYALLQRVAQLTAPHVSNQERLAYHVVVYQLAGLSQPCFEIALTDNAEIAKEKILAVWPNAVIKYCEPLKKALQKNGDNPVFG